MIVVLVEGTWSGYKIEDENYLRVWERKLSILAAKFLIELMRSCQLLLWSSVTQRTPNKASLFFMMVHSILTGTGLLIFVRHCASGCVELETSFLLSNYRIDWRSRQIYLLLIMSSKLFFVLLITILEWKVNILG